MTKSRLVLVLWLFLSACVPTQAASQEPVYPTITLTLSDTAVSPTPFQQADSTQVPTSVPTETPLPIPTATIPDDPELIAFIQECYQPSTFPTCLYSKGAFSLHLDLGGSSNLPLEGARIWDEAWFQGNVISILAHDFLDGKHFYELSPGAMVYVIYSTGSFEKYVVSSIERWKRVNGGLEYLTPWDGGDPVFGMDLVTQYYRGGTGFERLVLQTCIGGNPPRGGFYFFM
ncbi:MAG: hypothetical protein UW64_C0030G0021 [Microgenomates group bacterium GW2011_GWC1_44_37]|nr:MAG: hypothetical protein UW64_C0030G0021 [Microgenomates group bacterium GW2011_GWC1_44_37]